MEQMQRVFEVERVLNKHISSLGSDSGRSDMTLGQPVAWTERRKLFRNSFLSLEDLTVMVRSVFRASGEISFDELVPIFHGALMCDLQQAVNCLIENKHARVSGDHRYVIIGDKPASESANEIREEMETLLRFKDGLSRATIETINMKDGSSADDGDKTENDSDLPSAMSTMFVSKEPLSSTCSGTTAQGRASDELDDTGRGSLATSKDLNQWVRDAGSVTNEQNDKSDIAPPNNVAPPTNVVRSATNDSGVELNNPAGRIRCSTAEDYIRRASTTQTSSTSHPRTLFGDVVHTESQGRYRWMSNANDPVQRDPVSALERYCRLQGQPEPGFTVTFMPREKVHLCVLQVNNRAFRSYPTMARTHKRATEVAAENAIAELGITQKLLDDLEERNATSGAEPNPPR